MDVVLKREGFEGFEPIEEEIVSIGRSMSLEVDEADVADLIEEYAEELMMAELKELQKISHSGVMMELSSEEEVEPERNLLHVKLVISLASGRKCLILWKKDTQRNCLQGEQVPYLMIGVSHSFVTF
ncbi:hypothetical protein NPIL_184511 [Nephila pilipes]|uniref:Uncharacterized protein n=1 Tax=Nephila pilipes TaxID=299642 RepID=A0A8X6QYC5_NEPPI|nr:hypothetical protein NPIL_184511 [Nephila pilipes]